MMYRKKGVLLFVFLIVFTMVVSPSTIVANQELANSITVIINDKIIQFEQPPISKNNRTLVPMRKVFEELGASVIWDDLSASVKAQKDNIEILLKPGDINAFVNSKLITLDQPAELINETVMIPIRFVSETFGAKVEWFEVEKTVRIFLEEKEGASMFFITPSSFNEIGTWIHEGGAVGAFNVWTLRGKDTDKGEKKPAVAEINVINPGEYKVWVRSRDLASNQPGTRFFNVSINGNSLKKTFGKHGNEGYYWEDGGIVNLQYGKARVELLDTSEFYARCDGIFITKDLSYIPKAEYSEVFALCKPSEPEFPPYEQIEGLKIDSKYPGGNIKVVGMEDEKVKLQQELRDTPTWWFYWNFSAESDRDREITFDFILGDVVGPWGPAVSKDGVTWEWLGKENFLNHHSFSYILNKNEKVYFAYSLPYQQKDFESFYEKYSKLDHVAKQTLTTSKQSRQIPMLLIGNADAKKHIVFTARHHSCESTASYVLEGLTQYLIESNNTKVLNDYLFHIIPFVDIDGVENGDQGKNRAPHDHNRDYSANPIYDSTKGIYNHFEGIDISVGIDFHNPYQWGGINDNVYHNSVNRGADNVEEVNRFTNLLYKVNSNDLSHGKLDYDPKFSGKPSIQSGNSGLTSTSYFSQKQAKLAMIFEVPYFGTKESMVTQESMRNFGRNFAKALEEYLEN